MTHLWEFKKYLKGLGYYLSEEESEPGEDYVVFKHPKTEVGGKYVCLSYFEEGHHRASTSEPDARGGHHARSRPQNSGRTCRFGASRSPGIGRIGRSCDSCGLRG